MRLASVSCSKLLNLSEHGISLCYGLFSKVQSVPDQFLGFRVTNGLRVVGIEILIHEVCSSVTTHVSKHSASTSR